ncbi:MAG: hypothetical protein KQI81_08720 [Deltaproteobacteria bacterium]|nr:hypothetical protein [Deltaproteobacteria bacterium]
MTNLNPEQEVPQEVPQDQPVDWEDQTEVEEEVEEDFFADIEEAFELPSENFITISVNGASPRYQFTEVPMTANDLLTAQNIRFNGAYSMWLENNVIDGATVIPVGSTLMLIGEVKGG